MAAPIQSRGSQGSTSALTVSLAYTSNVTAGSLLVMCTGSQGPATTTATTATDSKSQTWTRDENIANGTTNYSAIFSTPNAGAGATTVTATWGGSGLGSLILLEYGGMATSSPVDGTAHNHGTGNAGTHSPGAITTLTAGDVVVSTSTHNTTTGTPTPATGYALESSQNTGGTVIPVTCEDQTLTGTATTTASFTWVNNPFAACVVAYKPSGGAVDPFPAGYPRPQDYRHALLAR